MQRRFFLTGAGAVLASACSPAFPPERIVRDWPPIGKFAQSGALKVHHTDEGSGQPVILIHGASGNLRDMTFSLAPAVSRNYRAIAMDRPGFGYSDRPEEQGFDPAVQARILRGAALDIGAEKPIIVGHSWAGSLVLSWALQFPEEVGGVVILSGATMPWGGDLSFFYTLGASPVFGPLVADMLSVFVNQGRINDAVERVFEPQTPPPGYAAYIGGPLSTRPMTVRANSEDLDNLNEILKRQSQDYANIDRPVEILHGTVDKIVGIGIHSVPLNQRLPRSNLTILEGIGHMPHHAAQDEVLAAIGRLAALT